MLVAGLGARALSRGSHLELREQRIDYIKAGAVGNKDMRSACLQIPQRDKKQESATRNREKQAAEFEHARQHGNLHNDSIHAIRREAPSVSHLVQNADRYCGYQAINPEQIPAVTHEPLAEPFERYEPGDKRAHHPKYARYHRGR